MDADMNADSNNPGEVSRSTSRPAARGGARNRLASRAGRFMVAPTRPDVAEQTLKDWLAGAGDIEILRMLGARGSLYPPVAVIRASRDKVTALQRTAGAMLVIEPDEPICAAGAATASAYAPSGGHAAAPGFTTMIEVRSDAGRPVEGAEVELIGQRWSAQGLTGRDGKVTLTVFGELPQNVEELIVRPRDRCWGLWQRQPDLAADAVNSLALRLLADIGADIGADMGTDMGEPAWGAQVWGAQAMQVDRLPAEYRGRGVKIALIDSGVATSHRQLRQIARGFEVGGADGGIWSQDAAGHGTPCAGIIAAATDGTNGIRGIAPEAELHVCALPIDPHCSDLAAALDYCVGAAIDVACIGFACPHGSTIVEQRIAAAKQGGLALVAPAGSNGGPVQFPACSRHVLAVGAIGQLGTFPPDSPQAAHAASAAAAAGGLFVPAFSCRGLELDLCAPGVAVMVCQAPDGYAVCDGTSLAAAHVAALTGLVLAHHIDFRRGFSAHNAMRAERAFQILKETAQPIGQPWLTGAGVPDAARALGRPSQVRSTFVPLRVGLAEMRNAMQRAGLADGGVGNVAFVEPPRGAATVTCVPLNPSPLTIAPAQEGEASIKSLMAAMRVAGLSAAG